LKFFRIIIDLIIFFLVKINRLFYVLFKISFIGYFKEKLENECYQKKLINSKEIIFFCPNKLIEWRVKTFSQKEPETLEWIDNFDSNGKTIFWDIGANIGLYSIYAATKFDSLDIFAFEPSTSNLRVLSRNISLNNFEKKIKIVTQPLSNIENQFSFFNESNFKEGGALNTFQENYNFTGKSFKVENNYQILGTSINKLIGEKILELPDFIKIDVDGIEHLILKGGNNFLKDKKIKSILVEVNENFLNQFASIKEIMYENNFTLLKKERNDAFYKNPEFEKMYNYIFQKN